MMKMMRCHSNLRDYQRKLAGQCFERLIKFRVCYLAMEVRTGKTYVAIGSIPEGSKCLFITKKKAIEGINEALSFLDRDNFTVINYESLHKIEDIDFEYLVIDEAHSLGQIGKKSKRVDVLCDVIKRQKKQLRFIFLSGTPTPESYSQIYHQYYICGNYSPFANWSNFYKWAKDFVNVKEVRRSYGVTANDYSDANKELIEKYTNHLTLTFSQKDANFSTNVVERVLYVDMKTSTYKICNQLKKDKVVEGKNNVILAETPVKMISKLHQLYSGTIKFEDNTSVIIDYSKAEFIRDKFTFDKIAIFYKFKEEFNLLKKIFPDATTELEEFNNGSNVFLGQIQSVREGVNLSAADKLIMYNIDFSATSYWQGKDRLSTMNRDRPNEVFWIFSKGGIEDYVYKSVKAKKNFTAKYYE